MVQESLVVNFRGRPYEGIPGINGTGVLVSEIVECVDELGLGGCSEHYDLTTEEILEALNYCGSGRCSLEADAFCPRCKNVIGGGRDFSSLAERLYLEADISLGGFEDNYIL